MNKPTRPTYAEPGVPFGIRIDPSLAKRIRKLAKKEKVTVTSILEVCLRQSLPEMEKP